MEAYASKLIDLIELKAEKIAKQRVDDMMKHDILYHSLPEDMVIARGIDFYKLFCLMSLAENLMRRPKHFPGNMRRISTAKCLLWSVV